MPPAKIRVIATPNGGGFGGKSDPFNHEIVVAHLSRVTGRPVKICLTREEVFYCHRGRHPTLMRVKTGVKKDGAITALHFQTVLDGGGYGSYGVASTYYTGALQTVTYQVPSYRFDGARVFTNKPPCGPKRGHGTPQPRFALEVELDRIAVRPRPRPGRDAPQPPAAAELAHGQLPARRLDRPRRVHRQGRRRVRLEEAPRQAAAGPRPGARVLVVPLRRGPADLLEHDAAVGRAAEDRPRRGSHRLLRLDGHRPGLRLDPRVDRRGGARHRSLRHPHRHGRHGPDARRPRLLLLARHAHDRQRRHPGGRAREADDRRGGRREARDPARARRPRRRPRVRRREPGDGNDLSGGRRRRRVEVRHARDRGLLLAAAVGGALPRRRRRPLAGVLLLGRGRRGRGRSRDRHLHGAEDLDRARRRQVHQPGARDGPGRGLRVHGPRRGDDGGDGVPHRRERATSSTSSRRCSSTRARPRRRCRRS